MRNIEAKFKFASLTKEVGKILAGAARDTIQKSVDHVAAEAQNRVAIKTGRLKFSIKGKTRKARNEDRIIGNVSTNTKGMPMRKEEIERVIKGRKKKNQVAKERRIKYGYGLDQEIGQTGRKYKFKPYLRPALRASIPWIQKTMQTQAASAARTQRKGVRP